MNYLYYHKIKNNNIISYEIIYKLISYTVIESHLHEFVHKYIIIFELDLFNNRALT
jgi:hypothetical protein